MAAGVVLTARKNRLKHESGSSDGQRRDDCGVEWHPMACSLRPTGVAPDVITVGVDAADDGIGIDRSGHRFEDA